MPREGVTDVAPTIQIEFFTAGLRRAPFWLSHEGGGP